MKKILLSILVLCIFPIQFFAQSPISFNYQAVIRDNLGELIVNQNIGFQISILDGSTTGAAVFVETHSSASTNEYGIVNISIGKGDLVSGDLNSINWGTGNKYLKIEIDETGGITYTELGIVQLLSVPYALYANDVANKNDADADPLNEIQDLNFTDNILTITNNTTATQIDLSDPNVYSPVTDTLFVVKDNNGNVVFAVFPDGAQVYVNEGVKGTVGGFAVSGRSPGKAIETEYLRVTTDSTRIYIDEPAKSKGSVGGFAVSGRNPSKGETSSLMSLTKNNYFIGHDAGKSNTEGLYNSFIGYNAGYSNTIGNRNTFLGYYSGHINTVGNSNIFIGDSSGYYNESGYYNIFLGNNSGTSNTEGYRNVFIGNKSGLGNINGRYNVFIGDNAGYSNTTGGGNVVIGATSGYLNTSGYYNVFLGNWSGRSNTIGHENIFVGNRSGWYNSEGNKNIFIGSFSGYKNELGSNNIFFGDSAGYTNTTADNNIFIGNKSGFTNLTGTRNVFLGLQSGFTNETGNNNVFIGNNAGFSNTDGYKNIFIGDSSGYLNAGGRYNVFIGDKVGFSNTEGLGNVIIGATAGQNNTIGNGNTFVGNWSGNKNQNGKENVFLGNKAGWNNISGSRNVYVGDLAGYNNLEGWHNIFIGRNAGINELGSGKLYIDIAQKDSTGSLIWGDFYTNIIRINGKLGINTHPEVVLELVDTSGSAVIMAKGIGDNYSYAKLVLMSDEVQDKSWDIRHNKSNNFEIEYNDGFWHDSILVVTNTGELITGGSIIPFNDNLDSIGTSSNRWNVVYATNNVINTSDKRLKNNIEDLNYGLEQILKLRPVSFNWKDKPNEIKKLGLIAQEVQAIINEVVDVGNDKDKTLGISYSAFVPVLIKGMQDQQKVIVNQQEVISDQQKQIDKLKTENIEFKNRLTQIEELLKKK